ncbi:hypothetical protein F7725_023331 [Dissostichus mawsoni]|uniref:Uncharacterized protein n=1 Tax=Dissostichus mawsoni TaxID=36200 RepID=A0A7J5Z0V7_DISMA|nr:hypothetical protein F7725_023331 [Dissostichus mawsoni]
MVAAWLAILSSSSYTMMIFPDAFFYSSFLPPLTADDVAAVVVVLVPDVQQQRCPTFSLHLSSPPAEGDLKTLPLQRHRPPRKPSDRVTLLGFLFGLQGGKRTQWRCSFVNLGSAMCVHESPCIGELMTVVPGLNGPGREPPVLLLLSARIFIFEELLLLLSSSPLVFHVESWDWASPKCLRTARVSPPVEWQRRVGDDMESVKAIPLNRYQGTACVLLRGLYRERVDIRSVHEAKNSSAGQLQVPGHLKGK